MWEKLTDFESKLKELQDEVNEIIYSYMPDDIEDNKVHNMIVEAMNYSVSAGGKRLRPILLLETYRSFASDEEEDIVGPFVAAIEMIHTYSLVHDDLPAMDNDLLRRGKPTTHAKFGHAMGVLAGDALLNYAFETMCKAFSTGESDAKRNIRVAEAIKCIAVKSGIYGMIGGQTIDVLSTGKVLSDEEMTEMYEMKTCALIEASVLAGATLAGADVKTVADLTWMASYLGMAFQIRDDVLDLCGDQNKLGKDIGSDEKNQKKSYAVIHGVEDAKKRVDELTTGAYNIARNFKNTEFICELIRSLSEREV